MKQYADVTFYKKNYLIDRTEVIPEKEFSHWSMLASSEICERTFGKTDFIDDIPDSVRMCCCEVAERLYRQESVRGDNGMILQSYGNDGETGTFKADEFSADALKSAVSDVVNKWLANTGLLYCGV